MRKNRPDPSDISLRDFIAAVGSGEQAHGIVSAAATAGSLGASLLLVAAALPQAKAESAADRMNLIDTTAALTAVQQQLIETIETETAVKLFAARNMPQANDAQRSERQAAIQFALRVAADVPLEVMRLCARGLKFATTIASHSTRAALAEVQLGVALLQTGFNGARNNLERKLGSFTDDAYVTSLIDEVARLSEEAAAATDAVDSSLRVLPA